MLEKKKMRYENLRWRWGRVPVMWHSTTKANAGTKRKLDNSNTENKNEIGKDGGVRNNITIKNVFKVLARKTKRNGT